MVPLKPILLLSKMCPPCVCVCVCVCVSLNHPKSGKGVRGDVKSGELDVLEEEIELFRPQNDLGQWFVPHTLSQHHPTVQSNIRILIPVGEGGSEGGRRREGGREGEREGGREREREGEREGGREGGRAGGREGGRERGREKEREGEREGGRGGGRERGRNGGRMERWACCEWTVCEWVSICE